MATSQKAESTAVATRDAKKEQREQLRASLEKFHPSFAKVLPKHLTPDRMVTLALVAATKTPQLLQCTPESIASSQSDRSRGFWLKLSPT